ncbi:molybdopterin molybdenumtransferase MoeA [Marinomonas agarivorans]|nr:molybdopterin molybdenumtransferase MoeA [Marinomonas agarivorans]
MINPRTNSSLMPFQDALQAIQSNNQCLVETEDIPVYKALSRILAEDIISTINVPPADNSAMDGYALNTADWRPNQPLKVSQRIPAGTAPQPLEVNTCARIFTGAEIPAGADCVIMQENAIEQANDIEQENDIEKKSGTEKNSQVVFTQEPKPQNNIRPQGQDIRQGDVVFHKGQKILPQHIGMLANVGITDIRVYKKLKVGILTTGDELIPPGTPLQKGQIYNSNGPMLCTLIEQWGHKVEAYKHVIDDYDSTVTALTNMTRVCDFVLSCGGVSVGEEDHIKEVIEKNGTFALWKVAMKPGKPLLHAKLFNTPFLGLPGNPSSTLVTSHFFAKLALAISAGQKVSAPTGFPILAGFERNSTLKRDEFLRVNLEGDVATPHSQQSSGALHAACTCDGYLHIPANTKIEKGKPFTYFPFYCF